MLYKTVDTPKLLKYGFIIFGLFNGLGIINPFNLNTKSKITDQGIFSPLQIVSVLFIGILIFFCLSQNNKKRLDYKIYHLNASVGIFLLLYIIILFITDYHSLDYTFIIKLIMGVSLIYLVPPAILKHPNLLYFSMLALTLVMTLISVAFSLGLLNNYMRVGWENRITLFGENPNTMSGRASLSMLIILDFVLANPFRLKKWRYVLFLTYIPFLILMFANGSRGSFIIFILCTLTYFLVQNTKSIVNKYIGIIIGCTVLATLILYVEAKSGYSSLFERLEMTSETGNTAGRDRLIRYTMDIVSDNYIIGVGRYGYQKEMKMRFNEHLPVHNSFLYILVTSGLFGFIPYTLFWFYLLIYSWRIRKEYPLCISLFMWAFLIANKTGGVVAYLLLWYVFSLVCSYIQLGSNRINIQISSSKYKI